MTAATGTSTAEAPPTRRWSDFLPALAVAAFTLAVQIPILDLWFNFMDEGHMVQFADMAANGGQFYRDATFYPLPGAFWFLALAFKVFEPSVILTRWLVSIQFAAFVGLLFILLRRVVSISWALVGVAGLILYRIWCFPHWQIYSYSTTSLLVLVITAVLLGRFFESGERRALGLSGFVFGIAVLCKQDYAAAFMVGVVPIMVLWARTAPDEQRWASGPLLGWFFGPAALVGAATGLYYLSNGLLADLLQFTVFNHFTGMSVYEYTSFPDLLPLIHPVDDERPAAILPWLQDPALRTRSGISDFMPGIMFTTDWATIRNHWLFNETPLYDITLKLFYYAPQALLALVFVKLFRRRASLRAPLRDAGRRAYLTELVIAGFGAGLLGLVWLNKPQDYLHLAVLYWPLLLLAVIQAQRFFHGHPKRALAFGAFALVPGLAFIAYSGHMVEKMWATHTEIVDLDRAGIYAKPAEKEMLEALIQYVDENSEPGDRVAAIPYFPIVNFFANRLGPHRSAYIIWPFPEIEERDLRVVEAMEETQTDLVIWNFSQFYSFPPVWEYAPILFEYLVDHFETDRVFSYDGWGYKLAGLKRSPEGALEARGELLIDTAQTGVSLRVEGESPPQPVSPDARGEYFDRALWPFRRVIALRPTAAGERTILSVEHHVPEGGELLSSSISVHPQWWFKLPPTWVQFNLMIESDGRRESLFSQRLNPTLDLPDRRWFDFEVDLTPWAGRDVRLLFINESERTRGETRWMGGWWEPRVRALSAPVPDQAG